MATIQTINIGTSANDNTGDTLRNAFDKTNQNNTALNNDLATKAPLASPTITGTLTAVNDAIINGLTVGKGNGNLSSNVALGAASLAANTIGYNNTSIGTQSLQFNTIAFGNTALGNAALYLNTIGSLNTANGTVSLSSNISGARNSAFGNQSMQNNTTGSNNTAIGDSSLFSNTIKSYNTALGFGAASNSSAFENITCLGYDSQITASNQVQLGDALTTTYVYGTVQNRSDLRDKADVQDTVLGLDFISKLRPVDYKWDMREDYKTEFPIQGELSDKDFKVVMDAWLEENKLSNLKQDGSQKRNRFHHGFIAQEVRDLGIDFGGFQDHSINGGEDVLSIGYDEFIAPMIKAIQELKAEIELLKSK